MEAINWTIEHKEDIIGIYTAIVTLASILIKILPRLDADDKFKNTVKFIGKYIALNR